MDETARPPTAFVHPHVLDIPEGLLEPPRRAPHPPSLRASPWRVEVESCASPLVQHDTNEAFYPCGRPVKLRRSAGPHGRMGMQHHLGI